MKYYYYLALNNEFLILVGQGDTDRIGLVGATFSTENLAQQYVEARNEHEADRVAEGS